MENQPPPPLVTKSASNSTRSPLGISQQENRAQSTTPTVSTSAPSVAAPSTAPSPGSAAASLESFLTSASPPSLSYPSLRPTIIPRPNFDPSLHLHAELFNKIVSPYNADAFELMLNKHNLSQLYPDLVTNLRLGFPLGEMGTLLETRILDNIIPSPDHWPLIDTYLLDEVSSGRMDGPFSRSMVESILRGPFQASPLLVVVQPQAPGEPDKIRICRHLSKSKKASAHSEAIPSVNSFIHKETFPTRFDTIVKVAEAVSHLTSPSFSHFHIFP